MLARRLNLAGMERFETFVRSLRIDASLDTPLEILTDPELSEPIEAEIDAEPRRFHSRLEVAEHLTKMLRGDPAGLRNDTGFWSWLSLCWFDELCPEIQDQRQPGDPVRWVAVLDDPRKTCRHLLVGPYQIFQAHKDEPLRAMCLLCGSADKTGPLVHLLASRPSLASCPSVAGVATRLYYQRDAGRNRPGLGSRTPGSPARLIDVLSQLEMNWDLYTLSIEELLALLPSEFDHFSRPATHGHHQRSLLDDL
ncbi:MAG: hypothetical protein JNL58_19810 [Planctomyces sp.]|nr:hypothetical protein [Planctomyces sp.]